MRKILITGGAGFIGYHLSKALLKDKDVSLVLIDNLQRGKMDDDLKALLADPRVTFINGDLTVPETYKDLPRDVDHVYHLAAVNGTKWFYKMPAEVLRINIMSLMYVLDWIKGLDKKPKLCFTSSNEAYAGALSAFGQLPLPTPENVPLIVEDTYNPRWTYGGSKLIGELFVIYYAQSFGFPAVIVRPHNFYGPRAGFDHVVPEMSKRIIDREESFVIYGSDESRTFCYIEDAVEAMKLLMESPKTEGYPVETVHIGDSLEVTMNELAENLFELSGYRPGIIEEKPGFAGSVKRRIADTNKIKNLINWNPTTSLQEGLKKTFEWYKNYHANNS